MASIDSKSSEKSETMIDFTQAFGPTKSASDTLYDLWKSSQALGIDVQDMYGNARPEGAAWLGAFEGRVAKDLGKEAGLFIPSGTMAQQVMLKIAQTSQLLTSKKPKAVKCEKSSFYAHHTSHLLRCEHNSYEELLNMSVHKVGDPLQPLSAVDLERYKEEKTSSEDLSRACALLLEVPHREIGGQMTSWVDIQKMKSFCEENGLWFHMDGARLWEAIPHFEKTENGGLSSVDLCSAFDSIYVSFYKGLGGMCGAMLLGDADFISEARVWMRRFGGNLFTALPYAVADLDAYLERKDSFTERLVAAQRIVALVKSCASPTDELVKFTPETPQCSLVHCHLKATMEQVVGARDIVQEKLNFKVFRLAKPSYFDGYTFFEWNFGPVNMVISEEAYRSAWTLFLSELSRIQNE